MNRLAAPLAAGLAIAVASCGSNSAPRNPSPVNSVSDAAMIGAVTSLTSEKNDKARYTDVIQMIEGRVPGLLVRRAGNDVSFQMRGTNAMVSEPLFVVDGMPIPEGGAPSALRSLNPNEVDRIDVLRDVGSAALYGPRGVNGVIVIKTKRR